MEKFLANAFSLQMLNLAEQVKVSITPTTAEEVAGADFTSCIGHQDTANVVSSILGKEVACNRVSVKLTKGDVLFVAQVVGGRLPEGCTVIPEGMGIEFVKVMLE